MNTEKQFLKAYDATAYPVVLVTVDTVLITFHEGALQVLLVKRADHPEKGKWGLPGGFLNQQKDASLEASARRSVLDKTGVEPAYLEQIETVGSEDRDPRGWSVSVIYSALMAYESYGSHIDSVDDIAWVAVDQLAQLTIAFDHKTSIDKALARYRQKALYSFVPVFAIPQPCSVTELRKVHEALIGQDIQRKSFIRRFEASNMFTDTGKVKTERGRPALLYRPKKALADYRFIRNIESSE